MSAGSAPASGLWPRFSALDGRATDRTALQAACKDLAEAFPAPKGVHPWLLVDSADMRVVDGTGQPRLAVPIVAASGRTRTVHLIRPVVGRAVGARTSPVDLLAFALAARDDLDESWRPSRIGEAVTPTPEQMAAYVRLFRPTDAARRVERIIDAGFDALVEGTHSSGKTTIAGHLADLYLSQGQGVVWLDLTDSADGLESIMAKLLRSPGAKVCLLVIDSVHANLPVVDVVLTGVLRLKSEFSLDVRVLATGWESAREQLPEPFRIIQRVRIRGEDLITELLNDLDPVAANAIRNLARGDIFLADRALEFYRNTGTVPTDLDLQRELTAGVVAPKAQEALYTISCLGFFELDVSVNIIHSDFAEQADWLRANNVIWRTDSSYTIGPRARAELIMRHALREWDARRWGRPEELTRRYLHRMDERSFRALLRRLDLGAATSRTAYAMFLLRAWEDLGRLRRTVERLSSQSPDWNDRVGAASFAALALATEDCPAWSAVAAYLRQRWPLESATELPTPLDGPTTDYATDFAQIQQRMAVQDNQPGDKAHLAGQTAADIDREQFYRTWALGLLLGVEGTAPPVEYRHDRVEVLQAIAERVQHHDGYFYPRRVSWLTARVVLGLCQTGEDYRTSPTVRKACDWLQRSISEGGALDSWWRSGTGDWNSDEVTTGLVLTALYRANAELTPGAAAALDWLIGQEARWTQPRVDVDLAHVLEALFLSPARPDNLYQHVGQLLISTLDSLNTPPPDGPEEGHRLPFATAQLGALVWTMINRELTNLLREAVEGEAPAGVPAVPRTVPAGAPPGPQPAAAAPRRLTETSLARWNRTVDRLLRVIEERLYKHADLPPVPAVEREVRQLNDDQARVHELAEKLRADAADAVLDEIEDIGRRILTVAWPEPPRDREG